MCITCFVMEISLNPFKGLSKWNVSISRHLSLVSWRRSMEEYSCPETVNQNFFVICFVTWRHFRAFSIIPVPYSIEHSPLRCDGGERGAWEGLHLEKNNRFVTFSLLSVCSHLFCISSKRLLFCGKYTVHQRPLKYANKVYISTSMLDITMWNQLYRDAGLEVTYHNDLK